MQLLFLLDRHDTLRDRLPVGGIAGFTEAETLRLTHLGLSSASCGAIKLGARSGLLAHYFKDLRTRIARIFLLYVFLKLNIWYLQKIPAAARRRSLTQRKDRHATVAPIAFMTTTPASHRRAARCAGA